MKVLVLHGWFGSSELKCDLLQSQGHTAYRPSLSNWSFSKALKQAQTAYDAFQPDVIVAQSRGGAVAMNINSGKTPLILCAPAYQYFGKAKSIDKNAVVIHALDDKFVSVKDSLRLGSKKVKVKVVKDEHRLNGSQAVLALKKALRKLSPEFAVA